MDALNARSCVSQCQQLRAFCAAAPVHTFKRAVWATAAAVRGLALIQDTETTSNVGIRCVPTAQNLYHLNSICALKTPYVPFPNNGDGHLETLAGAMIRDKPNPTLKRELLPAPDGGTVCLDWHVPADGEAPLDPKAPVLVLIAGLTGGSDARYVCHAVVGAAKRGMRAVVYNHCGVCGSPVTSPRLYSACFTGDLRQAISAISHLYPDAPLLAAAFSIGANVLVHYLAEEADAHGGRLGSSRVIETGHYSSSSSSREISSSDGNVSNCDPSSSSQQHASSGAASYVHGLDLQRDVCSCSTTSSPSRGRLTAAVSLCNPFNLTMGDWNWRRPDAGFRRAYDMYLAARMREVFRDNWGILAGGASLSHAAADSKHSNRSVVSTFSSPCASQPQSSGSGIAHLSMQRPSSSNAAATTTGGSQPALPVTDADRVALASISGVFLSEGPRNGGKIAAKDSSSNSSATGGFLRSSGKRNDAAGSSTLSGTDNNTASKDGCTSNLSSSSASSNSSSSRSSSRMPCSTSSSKGSAGNSAGTQVSSSGLSQTPSRTSAPSLNSQGAGKGTRYWPAHVARPLVPVTPIALRAEDACRAWTVRDFDDAATRHWFGFSSVDEYYAAASSGHQLHAVNTPLLCISASDDPICPKEAIPLEAFDTNPDLLLLTTPTGGHLGWVDLSPEGSGWRGRPWTEDVMLDYLQSVLAMPSS